MNGTRNEDEEQRHQNVTKRERETINLESNPKKQLPNAMDGLTMEMMGKENHCLITIVFLVNGDLLLLLILVSFVGRTSLST